MGGKGRRWRRKEDGGGGMVSGREGRGGKMEEEGW